MSLQLNYVVQCNSVAVEHHWEQKKLGYILWPEFWTIENWLYEYYQNKSHIDSQIGRFLFGLYYKTTLVSKQWSPMIQSEAAV